MTKNIFIYRRKLEILRTYLRWCENTLSILSIIPDNDTLFEKVTKPSLPFFLPFFIAIQKIISSKTEFNIKVIKSSDFMDRLFWGFRMSDTYNRIISFVVVDSLSISLLCSFRRWSFMSLFDRLSEYIKM